MNTTVSLSMFPLPRMIRAFKSTVLLLLLVGGVSAQTNTTTDGSTPSGLAPGSPSGAYGFSGLDNVNLYNGNLNVALPLLRIGGRGSAGYQMMLALNTKSWQVQKIYDQMHDAYKYHPSQNAWTISAGYSPGSLAGRQIGVDYSATSCFGGQNQVVYPRKSITTLTFVAPDGTQHELRDVNYNGGPLPAVGCTGGQSRGTVFSTTDGSSMTFISSSLIIDKVVKVAEPIFPTGTLLMRDGTRYQIVQGKVVSIRDRNGNITTIDYSDTQMVITDSLRRKVTVTYSTTQTSYTQIEYNGFGGAFRYIRVNTAPLSTVLREGTVQTFGQLFPELFLGQAWDTYDDNNSDTTVVSSVTLPDGRQYQFRYNVYLR